MFSPWNRLYLPVMFAILFWDLSSTTWAQVPSKTTTTAKKTQPAAATKAGKTQANSKSSTTANALKKNQCPFKNKEACTSWNECNKTSDNKACYWVAVFYRDGRYGVKADLQQAVHFFDKLCHKKDAVGCFQAGLVYFSPNFLHSKKELTARSYPFFAKGCQLNHPLSCIHLSEAYQTGNGVKADIKKAFAHMDKACKLKAPGACQRMGLFYAQGLGTNKDTSRGIKLMQDACNKGIAENCYELAGLYQKGSGVKQDHKQALALFRKTCDLGFREGCHPAAQLLKKGSESEKKQAKLYLEKACMLGVIDACKEFHANAPPPPPPSTPPTAPTARP